MKRNSKLNFVSKVSVSAALLASLVVPNVASAAAFDVWNGNEKVGNLVQMTLANDSTKLLDVVNNGDKYRIELENGKTYLYNEANNIATAAITANPDVAQSDMYAQIETELKDKAEVAPDQPQAELAVESVTAINATTLKVVFNQEVAADKVVTTNFTILNKNSASIGTATKAVLSESKKEITLTIPALTGENAPYILFINKNALQVTTNSIEFAVPTVVPTITGANVTSGTEVELTTDVTLKGNLSNVVTAVKDITEVSNTASVTTATTDASGNFKITMDGSFFKAGHTYTATIAPDKLEDTFGNKNKEAIEYTFTVAENKTKPAITEVEYVQSTASGEIDAIVTFNIDVLKSDGTVNTDIQDRSSYNSSAVDSLTVLDSTESATNQTARVKNLSLKKNQILIQYVNNGITMETGKEYGLSLDAGEVKDNSLTALTNEITVGVAVNSIDVAKPTVTSVELQSAKEIKLTFSETVTYDTAKQILVDGFDTDGVAKTGDSTGIVAKVTMAEDGTYAILSPSVAGELFNTGTSSVAEAIEIVADAFVDNAGNKIQEVDLDSATFIDNAKPEVVTAKVESQNKITVTFTEKVELTGAATNPSIYVDGVEYAYAASAATTQGNQGWKINSNNIEIYDGDQTTFAEGQAVVLTADTVKSADAVSTTNNEQTKNASVSVKVIQ